jgi:hypothetical protein
VIEAGVVCGAVFFALYTPLQDTMGGGAGAVAAAALVATIPSTMVGVPADTVKKQLVVGTLSSHALSLPVHLTPRPHSPPRLSHLHPGKYPTAAAAARGVVRRQGPAGLFRGWQANLARDVPFAVMKMSLYEGLAAVYKSTWRGGDGGEGLGALDHGAVRAPGSHAAMFGWDCAA